MSDALQHECGIALVRLLKPLEFYKEKYGTAFYGIHVFANGKHNRGQDGAGFASLIWNQVKDILVECDQIMLNRFKMFCSDK
jgi:hypothetical protein